MTSHLLSASGLRKSYGPLVAVQNVDLAVPAGSCYGLLGPNGAGKSTLIAMLTGSIDPDSGSASLAGEQIQVGNLAVKQRIGYVPQDLALYEELSASENLWFFGTIYGLHGAVLKERIDRSLELAGLSDRAKGAVQTFSGGMKRRLNIAAAILHDPELLVLDEPTVGVDPQSRNLIFDTLEMLVDQRKTILYTTHYMEEAERLCNRVAIMDSGSIIAEGEVSELHRMLPSKRAVEIELDEPLARALVEVVGARVTQQSQTTLNLELENLTTDLPRLLSEIEKQGGVVASVCTQTPSLEQVFLHLTGRVLRD